MITLYKFGPIGEVADPSPFNLKVETCLKLMDLPYECQSGMKHMKNAPKKKMPYINDDGKTVADSHFIIDYLQETYGAKLDGHLTDEQKALSEAFIRMMEENLYWCLVHSRWAEDRNWPTLRKFFFGWLPGLVRGIISRMIRKDVIKGLYALGLGRHNAAEIVEIGARDLKALSDFLGDKTYFFGDKPSLLDGAAYAGLVQLIKPFGVDCALYDAAQSHQNLVDFTNRFHAKYFT